MRAIDWPAPRGSIVLLVLALAVGAVAAGGAIRFHDDAMRGYERQKERLASARSRYRAIDDQRRLIETWLPPFRALQEAGVIGEERRLAWIETLRASAARARLPSLRYRIERRAAYEAGLGLDGAWRPFATVVRLEAGLLHEGDLVRLIRELSARDPGLHRIERCDVRRAGPDFVMRPGAVNLSVECDLRWITFARPEERT